MKNILVVAPISPDALSRYLHAADMLDVEASLLMPQVPAPPFDTAPLAMRRVVRIGRVECNPPALLEAVAPLGRIDAVVPGGECAVLPAELIARALGLRTATSGNLPLLRQRAALRRAFAAVGVPQPRLVGVAGDAGELRALLPAIERFPVVLKPADRAGTTPIALCHDAFDVERQATAIFAERRAPADGIGTGGECLVEEYFGGEAYGAQAVVSHGQIAHLFVTRRFPAPLPRFDDLGHLASPWLVPSGLNSRIEAAARGVVAAAKITDAVIHIDLKVAANGHLAVIGGSCRVPGDRLSTLVELAYGVHLEKAMLCLKLGLPLPPVAPAGGTPSSYGLRYVFEGQVPGPVEGATLVHAERRPAVAGATPAPAAGTAPAAAVARPRRIGHDLMRVPTPEGFAQALRAG